MIIGRLSFIEAQGKLLVLRLLPRHAPETSSRSWQSDKPSLVKQFVAHNSALPCLQAAHEL